MNPSPLFSFRGGIEYSPTLPTSSSITNLIQSIMPMYTARFFAIHSSRASTPKNILFILNIPKMVRVHTSSVVTNVVKFWASFILPEEHHPSFPKVEQSMGLPPLSPIENTTIPIGQVSSPVPASRKLIYLYFRKYSSSLFIGKHSPILTNVLACVNIPGWTEEDLKALK